jgi:hypothetical protein
MVTAMEKHMTRFGLLGAAALVSTALAGPAMAQQVVTNPGYCAQFYPNANCQNKGPGNPYTGSYQRHTAYRNDAAYRSEPAYRNNGDNWNNGWHDSWNDDHWNRQDSGFWPGDVAANVVGGAAATAGAAIGTAGAIATAPFRGNNSYAYYNGGPRGGYDTSYAARNDFVCQPGTWFKGEDGRRHICQ